MGYFQIKKDDEIVGVVQDPVWVKSDVRGRVVRCEARDADGILTEDGSGFRHIAGANHIPNCVDEILIGDITESEFYHLQKVLETEK